MLELELAGALDQIALTPLERAPVRAGGHDPLQNRQEDGPLDVEAESPGLEEVADHGLKARLPPEALEDERRADALDDGIGIGLAVLLGRREDHEVLAEASRRAYEAVDGSRLVEPVEPAYGGEDGLPDLPVDALVLDELEVLVLPGLLGSEEHAWRVMAD